ncbi:UL3.5 protein [Gallid alphaherpesvirus 3]|uniref:UL3.5 product homolog n=2 Tax=Gallid alphaherpesvirus 3 TaxID=35250 RepID=Q9QTE0_9ALPH|nr:protein V57 [Gallid alphaherpesvirus 3]BAA82897.1 UL3.5 product homolog [Marek's disease virus serotype 2 MDV2]BAB16511.1 UL3.5 protein [Gallid alphaherpesvirus 3]
MFVVSAALASASDYAAFLRDNKQAARKLQFPLSPMPSQRIPHLSKDGRTAVARETGSSEVMSASGQTRVDPTGRRSFRQPRHREMTRSI